MVENDTSHLLQDNVGFSEPHNEGPTTDEELELQRILALLLDDHPGKAAVEDELSLYVLLGTLPADHVARKLLKREIARYSIVNIKTKLAPIKEAPLPGRVMEVLETAQKRYGKMYEAIPAAALRIPKFTFDIGMAPWNSMRAQLLDLSEFDSDGPSIAEHQLIRDGHYLWDTTTRPHRNFGDIPRLEYTLNGGEDPLGEELAHLTSSGQIEFDNELRSYDSTRFGRHLDEINGPIMRLHSKNLKLRPEQGEMVTVRTSALMFFVGNIYHPEIFQVNSSEWVYGSLDGNYNRRSVGSNGECIISNNNFWGGGRNPSIGFSPVVFIPAQVDKPL